MPEDKTLPNADAGPVDCHVMQHTPGPWHVDMRHYGTERGHVAISAEQHTALAQVVWQMVDDDCPLPSGIANARLIAAAPDLLKCLRSLYRAPLGQGDYAAAGELLKRLGAA